MRFQEGQMVKCIRAVYEENLRVVGSVGQIEKVLQPVERFLFLADYVVYFPAFHSGYCPSCTEFHDRLFFTMLDEELAPVGDPDAQTTDAENRELQHG